MPLFADHAIDFPHEFYRSIDVTRLHEHKSFTPADVNDGDVIFVKTDFIYKGQFQKYVLPHIKNKFVLVSGGSSYHIGSNHDVSYQQIIKNKNLIAWFCTNPPDFSSEKVVPLPIGFEERERAGGDQKSILQHWNSSTKFHGKKNKILLPYHTFDTNPERRMLFERLSRLPFVDTQLEKKSWSDYMSLVAEYKFTICLEGSGPDVHRNYECLLVGSVPINVKNTIERLFAYHSLPGVFIDSWDKLKFENIEKLQYNFDNVEKFMKIRYHNDLIIEKSGKVSAY